MVYRSQRTRSSRSTTTSPIPTANSSMPARSRSSICTAADDIFPKIEEAVQDKKVGETVKVKLQPEEAFGDYDEELIQIESRDQFPKELQVGMQFEGGPEGGDDDDFIIYRVTDIADDKVVLDGNHPLAGMSLIFTCTVTAVRPASGEELAHGHVHSGDGEEGHRH